MSELLITVLKLIDEGYSINEICMILNISRKQLANVFLGLRSWDIEFNKRTARFF